MSVIGDAIRTIQSVVQLDLRVQQLEKSAAKIGDDVKALARDLYSVDKRVLRIETIIEMTAGRRTAPPAIEES